MIRRGLADHLNGAEILQTTVLHPRPVRNHPGGADGFVHDLSCRNVDEVRRKGKYLWWALAEDDALVVHLGMSGQFRFNRADEPLHRHTRVIFELSTGEQARFIDQRMFGGLTLVVDGGSDPVPHIAADPFDESFDPVGVASRLVRRRTAIKRALLDQRLVSGIGNIYADETLWRVQMHYDHPCDELSVERAVEVLNAARQVMSEALAAGGTSFDSLYVNVNGESGYFARDLSVYGREGQPCPRCGTAVVREPFMNRSSFHCPQCQHPRRVG